MNLTDCAELEDAADKCSHALDYCADEGSLLNYPSLLYCTSSYPAIPTTLLLLYLLYLLNLLATTADNYFVVQLQTLSAMLNLSDDVAGVTLLALGNGAPDVFTAISGLSQSDFQLALSDLLGGGIFINTIVLGAVILVTPSASMEVSPKPFLRDLCMYVLCTSAIFFFCLDGHVELVEALGFIAAYVMYIVVVLIVPTSDPDEPEGEASSIPDYASLEADLLPPNPIDDPDSRSAERSSLRQYSTASHFSHHAHPPLPNDTRMLGIEDVPDRSEDGVVAWLLWWAEYPISILRHLSIPSSDPFWNRRRRIYSALSPILGLQLVTLAIFGFEGFDSTTTLFGLNISLIAFVVGSLFSVLIYKFSNDSTKPSFFGISVGFAFMMSVVWLDLLANEIVGILETFGILMDVSTSVLGLTVLAWGNSIGDLVADTATAKAGKVKTAVASCFGSPLLSALVGLGLALTITTAGDGEVKTSIDTQNFVAICTLLFVLASSLVTFIKFNYRPPRSYAYVLFGIYLVFMAVSVALEALDS